MVSPQRTTCIPRIRLVKTWLTVCHNPLLPRTTSERENVEITVRAAQAIVTRSVVVIPIYSLSRFLLITYKSKYEAKLGEA